MENIKTIKGRIQHKHGTEADWYAAGTAATPFCPLEGELIVYDPDAIYSYPRTKYGAKDQNGNLIPVHLLPFANSGGGTPSGPVGDGIIGTWMFNEELDITLDGEYYVSITKPDLADETVGLTFFDQCCMGLLIDTDGNYIDCYEEGWIYGLSRMMTFTGEPDDPELAAWIKANAKRYESTGIDRITHIEQNQVADSVGHAEGGIFITNTTRFLGENNAPLIEVPFDQNIPIVAGDNVTFEVDEESKVVKINATSSGSESTTETDIFPLQIVSGFQEDPTFGGAYVANSPISFVLTEGETYHVEWDGTTYTCECKSGTFGGMDILYLGNDTLLGGQSSEPFTVGYYVVLGVVGLIAADNKTSHDIRIYQIVASGQPDWAQNDKAHPDYIKNRPFYETLTEQSELLAPTELTFTDGDSIQSVDTSILNKWLEDWTIARVTWDGVVYECEPLILENDKLVGNIDALGGGDNGLPFLISCYNIEGGGAVLGIMAVPNHETELTHEVSISVLTYSINHLDTKFIKSIPWKKISDKPFDMTPAGTIVAKGTENFAMPFDDVFAVVVNEIPLVNDTPYIVEFDGSTYNVTTMSAVTGTDVSIYYEDDGVLFAALNDLVPGSTVILALTAGNHTYKITVAEDIIKKIDPIYLPDSLPESTATSIDFSSYETNGQIVETFADGSTKTTTVEFDAGGNPIKMTDSNGNETVIIW